MYILNQFIYYPLCIPFFIYTSRIIQTYLFNSINYTFCKNSINAISSFQIKREQNHVFEGFKIHLFSSIFLSVLFPSMFNNNNFILECLYYTFMSHIVIVEPLYYFIHRVLHVKNIYNKMHYFHHLSFNTIPSTALVQNFTEHFIYIGTFGPALFIPYFIFNKQHWLCIYLYLSIFDFINALGHCDFSYNESYYTSSVIKYLFYSPEFHHTHHTDLTVNYALFMPIWDVLFNTYREKIREEKTDIIDFVFIGHNVGLYHLLSLPQISIFNIYNEIKLFYNNIYLDFLIVKILSLISRNLGYIYWNMPKYNILKNNIGQVIGINETPLDYLQNIRNDIINNKIISLITTMNKTNKTQYFGLGNLNKMKSLNDSGVEIVNSINIIKPNTNIKILTGDTMTTASIYYSLQSKNIDNIYFIGGTGKIGMALTTLLINTNNKKICLYSSSKPRFEEIKNTLLPELQNKLTLSTDFNDVINFTNIIIGKQLSNNELNQIKKITTTKINIYDYNVPFFPIIQTNIQHKQIGLLENNDTCVLNGFFDISFGLKQRQIYPCYAGCLLGFIDKRQTNEVGEINIDEIDYYWKLGKKYGFTLVQ